jgi:hypothetical protein
MIGYLIQMGLRTEQFPRQNLILQLLYVNVHTRQKANIVSLK